MTRGELQFCPECRQRWPKGAEHDLRSFRWLNDLPRHVSPSNIDCIIHDGAAGRNRFLVFETKRATESADAGQAWLLRAVAGLSPERVVVRILHGNLDNLSIHRVDGNLIDLQGVPTTPELVRSAVVTWLSGSSWRDAEAGIRLVGPRPTVAAGHVHQWLKGNPWTCIGCPETWGTSESAGNPVRGEDKTEAAPTLSEVPDEYAELPF